MTAIFAIRFVLTIFGLFLNTIGHKKDLNYEKEFFNMKVGKKGALTSSKALTIENAKEKSVFLLHFTHLLVPLQPYDISRRNITFASGRLLHLFSAIGIGARCDAWDACRGSIGQNQDLRGIGCQNTQRAANVWG